MAEDKSDSDEDMIPVRKVSKTKAIRFDRKLYEMVSDPNLEKFICWADEGRSIAVIDSAAFEKDILKTTKFSRRGSIYSNLKQLRASTCHIWIYQDQLAWRLEKNIHEPEIHQGKSRAS
jgi:hypothetical protein